MAQITFITSENESITVEGKSGSVKDLALQYNIKGIDGDCGGVCSCATCHVHVSPQFMDKITPASEIEKDMLEFEDDADEYSRLSCQVEINEGLNGLILKVAK